ncbi:hypothetical protein, partial [Burkholderia oklahomensis]|uniref:hypothetical protein n=1 Tax=Burkholderia oklahomensis TaxID=342113 RepID=UPI001E2BED56
MSPIITGRCAFVDNRPSGLWMVCNNRARRAGRPTGQDGGGCAVRFLVAAIRLLARIRAAVLRRRAPAKRDFPRPARLRNARGARRRAHA